jgi:hypothetical protein
MGYITNHMNTPSMPSNVVGKSYLGKQHQFAFWEKFQQED